MVLKIDRAKIIPLSLSAAAAFGAVLVLFCFAPEHHAFYPRCVFHMVTGLQCPGCGGLRAAHRLLHGQFAEAFHLNPLLVMLAPLFVVWLAAYGIYEATGRRSWYPFTRPVWGWALLAVAVLFGITRNIVP